MSGFDTELNSGLNRFEAEINNIASINAVVRSGWNDSKGEELARLINQVQSDAASLTAAGRETVTLINQYL